MRIIKPIMNPIKSFFALSAILLVSMLYAVDNNTYIKQQEQMAELFQRDKSVITRHIGNIYSEGELLRESTSAKIAFVRSANLNLLTCHRK